MANTNYIRGTEVKESNEAINILYRTVMANAKEIGKKKYACIPRELLAVDEDYQRIESRSHEKISALARKWNHDKMDALIVVPHPEEGKFYIVDGYGRYVASALLEEPLAELECNIMTAAPTDPELRKRYEAELYVTQGDEVEALKAVQKHKANVILGNQTCMIIDDSCKAFGVSLVAGRGSRPNKSLGCYVKILPLVRAIGKEGLDFIFRVIEKTSWCDESNAYCVGVMLGLGEAYKMGHNIEGFEDALIRELRKSSLRTVKTKAAAMFPERDRAIALKLYCEEVSRKILDEFTKIKVINFVE